VQTTRIGISEITCSRLAYGNMRCVGTWDVKAVTAELRAAGVRAHATAVEAGYTLIDTADIYCHGVCEEVLGQALREVGGMRARVQIATKCGIRFGGDPVVDSPHRYDFSAKHIAWSCEQSLRRIGVDTIDLYYLHRPDLLMDPAEVAAALDELRTSGKVRAFAVSNFLPSTVAALATHCPFPLVANQIEVHLGRLDPLVDGTLDQCLERRMTPLSWSPLGGGWLGTGGEPKSDDPKREVKLATLAALDRTAGDRGVSRTVVALAWLLKHPAGIVPIVGSNNPDHIRDAAKADAVDLSREEWYRILLAARGKPLP
jgi:predicted oxidoreductase